MKHMDKINKKLIGILILANFSILNGAFLKIASENPNAGYLMIAGLVVNFLAIIGLIWYNFPKIKKLL